MFKKKNNRTKSKELNGAPDIQPKYTKPKIILIDLPSDALTILKEKGYNVVSGSFGHPYKVKQNSYDNKILTDANLPNYTEQEIIVIDLSHGIVNRTTEKEIPSDYRDTGLCAERDKSVIDPRPIAMHHHINNSERIIRHGGIFVIFAEPKEHLTCYSNYNRREQKYTVSNWSFLSYLYASHKEIFRDNGYEIKI